MDEIFTWDNIILAICAMMVTGCLGNLILIALFSQKTSKTGEGDVLPKEKVSLKELSEVWVSPERKKQNKEKIYLKDLYHLWRNVEEQVSQDDSVIHTFKTERIRTFFNSYVDEKSYFKRAPLQRSVVIQILRILDEEGSCPSVVNILGDPESSFSSAKFNILKRVSLMNHSLNVAKAICCKLQEKYPHAPTIMAPDALVVALGHDLGKLPRFSADGYTHGSHPLTSCAIMQGLKDFKLLKHREEIENAIKRHHQPTRDTKNIMLQLLQESDAKARVVEQDVVIGLDQERFHGQPFIYNGPKEESHAAGQSSLAENEENHRRQAEANATAWKEQEFLYGISDPTPQIYAEKAKETIWLDGWFDARQFLTDLEDEINKMDGMRIRAFSMPSGDVYVPRETMIKLVKKQASRSGVKWVTEAGIAVDLTNEKEQSGDQKIWANLLVGIADVFREQEFIDPEIITPGFYGNHFYVLSKPIPTNGTRFYTVFRAEAFSLTTRQLETKKVATKIRSIKKVTLAPAKGNLDS